MVDHDRPQGTPATCRGAIAGAQRSSASRLPKWVAAALLCAAASGCVSVRIVDEDRLPAGWKQQISQPTVRLPQGRFAAAGLLASGTQAPVAARLEEMFLPGQLPRASRAQVVELIAAPDGTFTAKAWRAGRVVAEVQLPYRLDPATGWLELERIPVKDSNKFGATVTTQSARVGIGSDGALYVRMSATAAGVVLFLPAFGTGTVWGRWEPEPAAAPRPPG